MPIKKVNKFQDPKNTWSKTFYDKKGRQLKDYDLIKIYFYTIDNKRSFTFKWVRTKLFWDTEYFVGMHMNSSHGDYLSLNQFADKEGYMKNVEIVQGYNPKVIERLVHLKLDGKVKIALKKPKKNIKKKRKLKRKLLG